MNGTSEEGQENLEIFNSGIIEYNIPILNLAEVRGALLSEKLLALASHPLQAELLATARDHT